MIVFLWLGNVVVGQWVDVTNQISPGDWVGDWWTNNNDSFIPSPTTTTYEIDPNQIEWQPMVTAWRCNKKWHLLDGQSNSINTTFGCDCEQWFKQVDNKCLDCNLESVCCGIELNTKVPFIGNCIEDKNYGGIWAEQAFPTLMWALTQILVTVILILSFVLILIWGIMIATGNASGGKKMIMKVVVGLALLWASGVILRLINPNFFG